jgi:hypothetical protein
MGFNARSPTKLSDLNVNVILPLVMAPERETIPATSSAGCTAKAYVDHAAHRMTAAGTRRVSRGFADTMMGVANLWQADEGLGD